MIFSKSPSSCCGAPPTLRKQDRNYRDIPIKFVQYECRQCKRVGGLGVSEQDAHNRWEHEKSKQSLPIASA